MEVYTKLFMVSYIIFCTLLDLNPEEFEFCIEDLLGIIKDRIKEGASVVFSTRVKVEAPTSPLLPGYFLARKTPSKEPANVLPLP